MEKGNIGERKDLILYFVITYAISWSLWLPKVLNSNGYEVPSIMLHLSNLAIFGPLIAALILIARKREEISIRRFLARVWDCSFDKKWFIPAIFLGPIIALSAYLLNLYFFGGQFSLGISLPNIPLVAVIILFLGGPVEEFGWRGFALDKLQNRINATSASLILGFIWAIWHLPLHFIEGTTQEIIPVYQFIMVTIALSVLYTWLYNSAKKSLLPVILFHWLGNLGAGVFIYWDNNSGRWIAFGITMLIAVVIIMIYGYKTLSKDK